MATRTVRLLVDDTDGGRASQTVLLGLDGVTYEIDLSEPNADQFRGILAPYIQSGRRVGGRRRTPRPRPGVLTVLPGEESSANGDHAPAPVPPVKSGAGTAEARTAKKTASKSAKKAASKAAKKTAVKPRSKASRNGATERPKNGGISGDGGRSQAIRQWASENGLEVGSTGRIPGAVVSAYDASR